MLELCQGFPEIRDRAKELGIPRIVRRALSTHQDITYSGIFDDLREWLRSASATKKPPAEPAPPPVPPPVAEPEPEPAPEPASARPSTSGHTVEDVLACTDVTELLAALSFDTNPPEVHVAAAQQIEKQVKVVGPASVMSAGAKAAVGKRLSRAETTPPEVIAACVSIVVEVMTGEGLPGTSTAEFVLWVMSAALKHHRIDPAVMERVAMLGWVTMRKEKALAKRFHEEGLTTMFNEAAKFFKENRDTAFATVGFLLRLVIDDQELQAMGTELNLPRTVKSVLAAHKDITFAGEFDSLKQWFRSKNAEEESPRRDKTVESCERGASLLRCEQTLC